MKTATRQQIPIRADHQLPCTKAVAIDTLTGDCEDTPDDAVDVDVSVSDEGLLEVLEMTKPDVAVATVEESVSDAPNCPPTVTGVVASTVDPGDWTGEETLPLSLLPVLPLASLVVESLVTEAGAEIVVPDTACVEATDGDVVGGRAVVKLDVGSAFTQLRS